MKILKMIIAWRRFSEPGIRTGILALLLLSLGLVAVDSALVAAGANTTPERMTLVLADGAKAIPEGPFAPSWESIAANYEVPTWLKDGKFGIFIHWGVYSVPARQSEWYARHMYASEGVIQWHREHYGPQDSFGYKDFIPMMRYEKYDPSAWAELFKKSGARFVMPVAEHHDGFAMYDSKLTRWDAADMGPKRDVLGDLANAVREKDLVFGLSNHRIENWGFIYPKEGLKTDLFDPENADFYGPPQPQKDDTEGREEVMAGRVAPQSLAFQEEWLLRMQELVDNYQPQIVFFDNGINSRALDSIKLRFAAYYYNQAEMWGKAATITTKRDAYLEGIVKDFERGRDVEIADKFWQCDTSIAHNSWGYIDGIIYRNAGEMVRELVDCVSKNGGYLLNIAPRADGTIPEGQQLRLLEIGAWLQQNGEAIYNCDPWIIHKEGPTIELPKPGRGIVNGMLAKYGPADMRFTVRDHGEAGYDLFATLFDWPGDTLKATIQSLVDPELAKGEVTAVHLLGYPNPLKFEMTADGLVIELPPYKPNEFAMVLKIEGLKS